jgi:hypothetical protein
MIDVVASPEIEIARQQWRDGQRRLEELRRDPPLHRRLLAQVDTVTAELRRRIGGTYTLHELADAYRSAEPWLHDTIEERDPEPGWERHATLVLDAAFDLYARGAADYEP